MNQAGGDVIGVDWRMPLDQARARLGPVALQGNLDPTILLTTQEIVEQEARRILQEVGDPRGYIFNLGHGVLPNTPVDNIGRLIDVVHKYSGKGAD
jgi:uroporphyrinogen decarboxylase